MPRPATAIMIEDRGATRSVSVAAPLSRSIANAAASTATPSSTSWTAPLTNTAALAPTNEPAIATAPKTSAMRGSTLPARQYRIAPTRLVVPTTGRLIAIAGLAAKPST